MDSWVGKFAYIIIQMCAACVRNKKAKGKKSARQSLGYSFFNAHRVPFGEKKAAFGCARAFFANVCVFPDGKIYIKRKYYRVCLTAEIESIFSNHANYSQN